jgi:indolepyruvate ferredoxin oxidoreductase beta subunit
MSTSPREPIRILIAALGGEGGGVLADWITRAGIEAGLHVTRTSIPGVAQRTGATTYHVELLPQEPGDPSPVLGLNAAPGRVEVMLATELLEAARRVEAGLATPDRTLAIVAHRRAYTVAEKSAAGDGRLSEAALERAIRAGARLARIEDFSALAARVGAPLNAVLLGALAASGAVPIPEACFRAAIRAGGKATESNLRGFETGLSAIALPPPAPPAPPAPPEDVAAWLPPEAARLAAEGAKRLADYQGPALASLYLDRLRRFAAMPGAEPVLAPLARQLALRMSPEDVIRVAQLKLREARRSRLAAEARARPGDIVHAVEFLKPGPAEILSLFPPALGRAALRFCDRRGWMGKALALNVSPTRPFGFLRLRLLAALRPWRPRSLGHAEAEAWVARWLDLVEQVLAIDAAAAREVSESARLVKGYGATEARGRQNWERVAAEVIAPGLAGRLPGPLFADALLQCRLAAQKDPEGGALPATLAAIATRIAGARTAVATSPGAQTVTA